MNSNQLDTTLQAASNGNAGAFVRGFFRFLAQSGETAAVLHGWEDSFDGDLSDIDFVSSRRAFARISTLVANYCDKVGWLLCQVLRHESTAAFCVCAWRTDPSVVVALDACSDYRCKERLLIPAEEMLENQIRMSWGGFRVSDDIALRYRLLKGAVKGKDASVVTPQLAVFPVDVRTGCCRWFYDCWGIEFHEWSVDEISAVWEALRRKITQKRPESRWIGLLRIVRRLVHPTGLIVVGEFDGNAVRSIFGHLYFRRNASDNEFSTSYLKSLVSSTLILVKRMHPFWRFLLWRSVWLDARQGEGGLELRQRIMRHLAKRCARREGIPACL